LDELLAYQDRMLVDASGEEIGTIVEIYFDEASGQPEWIGVDACGVLGSQRVVAPVRGSYVLADVISVPYTQQQVIDSGAGEMLITVEREKQLYAHYGLPYSRGESPTGLSESDDVEAPISAADAYLTE